MGEHFGGNSICHDECKPWLRAGGQTPQPEFAVLIIALEGEDHSVRKDQSPGSGRILRWLQVPGTGCWRPTRSWLKRWNATAATAASAPPCLGHRDTRLPPSGGIRKTLSRRHLKSQQIQGLTISHQYIPKSF